MKVCGVDLGKNGGIVVLEDGNVVFKTVMPVIKSTKSSSEYDIRQIVDVFLEWRPEVTYIEKTLLHPKSGKKSYQQSGFCDGLFQGILSSLNLSYDIISPKRWQRNIFSGMKQKDTKQASILFARRTQPSVDWRPTEKSSKYHDGMTDAYGLAVYCWRQYNGKE
jgi:hypothetical protein